MEKLALNVLAETPPPRRRPPGTIMKKFILFFFAAVFAIFIFAGDVSSELISHDVIEIIFACYCISLVVAAISFLVVCWRRGQLAGLLGSAAAAGLVLFSLWVAYSSGKRGSPLWEDSRLNLLRYFLWIAGPIAAGVLAHWKKRGWAIGWIFLSLMVGCLPLLMLLWIPDRYWDEGPDFSKAFVEFFDPQPAHLFPTWTWRQLGIYAAIGIGFLALLIWFVISTRPVPLK